MRETIKARKDLDYLALHRTGEKVEKIVEISLEDMSDQEDAMAGKPVAITERKYSLDESSKLRLQLEALSDDIDDFIAENSIHDIDRSLSDLDFVIKRMEEMRSLYMSRYKEISALLRVLGVLETSFDDNDIDEDVFANGDDDEEISFMPKNPGEKSERLKNLENKKKTRLKMKPSSSC